MALQAYFAWPWKRRGRAHREGPGPRWNCIAGKPVFLPRLIIGLSLTGLLRKSIDTA
jgi:hypothetical protein